MRTGIWLTVLLGAAVWVAASGRADAALLQDSNSLLGVNNDNGILYRISTTDASMTQVGSTGIAAQNWGALEYAPNGNLYSLTTSFGTPGLYRLDVNTGTATLVGLLNIGFVFEGGLAFAPNGTAYGVNSNDANTPRLFTINLQTGAGTIVGTMSGGSHDINGLAWRSDGMLIGIDRVSNSLVTINPTTAATSTIAPVTPTLGAIGGMTVSNGVGYFSTAATTHGSIPGSNELWRFDLFTGASQRVGSFSPTISSGSGIGGLAALVPEPASAGLLLGVALVTSAARRRRHART